MNELRAVGCVEVQDDDKMRRVEDEEGRGSLGSPCCRRNGGQRERLDVS